MQRAFLFGALLLAGTGCASPLSEYASPSAAVAAVQRVRGVDTAALAGLDPAVRANDTPQQLHITVGADLESVVVTWVTRALPSCNDSSVSWYTPGSASSSSAPATVLTYTAGMFGWRGWIFSASMSPVLPGVSYAYTVGCGASVSAPPRVFTVPPAPSPDAALRVAVTADMGTIVPLGWAVADALINDAAFERYDVVLMAGDLSYATINPGSCSPTNPGCDEVEWTWDAFGMQIEPFASTAPYITAVGNHEHVPGNITAQGGAPVHAEFAAYTARYPTPASAAPGDFWYSLELGPLHLAVISSEHPYHEGSPQWMWLKADLETTNRTHTPWLVAMLHRPVLSAAVLEWDAHCPGGPLSAALEPLFYAARVDAVLAGHIHSYERTHAVFNGTVVTRPAPNSTTYVDPGAPIYAVQGTSGGLPENVFFDPAPAWSAARILGSFGYGRLSLLSPARLLYEFVGLHGEVLDAWGINKTAGAAASTGAGQASGP